MREFITIIKEDGKVWHENSDGLDLVTAMGLLEHGRIYARMQTIRALDKANPVKEPKRKSKPKEIA